MALMFPASFPPDRIADPKRRGEAAVFDALQAALDDTWKVFYDRRVPGSRRAIDFIAIKPGHTMLALEVKGGLVHAGRRGFRQLVNKNGQRIATDPYGQTKKALAALAAAAHIDLAQMPVHIAAFFPMMSACAYPWAGTGPHIFTREDLEPTRLRERLSNSLFPQEAQEIKDRLSVLRQRLICL